MSELGRILQPKAPKTIALLHEGKNYSYGALEKSANRFANFYGSAGLMPGDKVSLLLGNDPLMVAGCLGAFKSGIVANPLHDKLLADEIAYIIRHAGSKLLVTDARYADVVTDVLGHLEEKIQILCFGEAQNLPAHSGSEFNTQNDMFLDEPELPTGADALLLYTSGTTGRPKGVQLTHENIMAGIQSVVDGFELCPSDRTLCVMSLSHTNALMFSTLSFLYAGGSTILCRRFSASNHWKLCKEYGANSFSASPTILSILLATDPANDVPDLKLKYVKVASAPTSIDLASRFEARFGRGLLLETYGLTETTAMNVGNPLHGPRRLGSIGRVLPPSDVRIVDEDGQSLPAGKTGELVIGGPTVMKGYLRDPDATAKTIRDGWLHTGDIATMSDDGFITIVGRKSETIIRGGENISPLEIERVIARHPSVLEAAVVGVPDKIWGEAIAACVVRKSEVSEQELIAFCSQSLALFKVPAKIAFVGELPRNPIGKLVRRALRQHFEVPAAAATQNQLRPA